LWKSVNRERGPLNNILTCNIHLEVENETISSPSRTCNIFNVTLLGTINKLTLDKTLCSHKLIISKQDSFALLEITDQID
jgi:hypothetical protein